MLPLVLNLMTPGNLDLFPALPAVGGPDACMGVHHTQMSVVCLHTHLVKANAGVNGKWSNQLMPKASATFASCSSSSCITATTLLQRSTAAMTMTPPA